MTVKREREGNRPGPDPREGSRGGAVVMLARIALGALTLILTVNVVTGFPLIALWVGSRFAGGDPLSMGAIVLVVIALAALLFAAFFGLSWLNTKYDQLIGRPLRHASQRPGSSACARPTVCQAASGVRPMRSR